MFLFVLRFDTLTFNMNLNKVFILGRLTADPQLKTIPSGQSVATFSVATNRVWTDKSGKKQEEVDFHNIVVWGRQAEIANQFLAKGSLVFIEGRLRTRSWQDKEGHTRKTTEIISDRLQLGPRAMGGSAGSPQGGSAQGGFQKSASQEIPDIQVDEGDIKAEDIPF